MLVFACAKVLHHILNYLQPALAQLFHLTRNRLCNFFVQTRRDDRVESKLFGFFFSFFELGDVADFAGKADLSDGDGGRRKCDFFVGGGDGEGNREVGCGLFDAHTADDVDEDVLIGEIEMCVFLEYCNDHLEAVEVVSVARSLRVAKICDGSKRLDFNDKWSSTFNGASQA